MLVVFDTCTKPDYYKDVHQVLALPTGAIIKYDYERRLWSRDAQDYAAAFRRETTQTAVLLMYGQVRNYNKGDKDPTYMLTTENAIFIPTRYAHVVNFAVEPHTDKERENINLHLQLGGFVSPDNPELPKLIKALEDKRELPFGRDNGYIWVSKCPDDIDKRKLSENNEDNWTHVVDLFASEPSQFSGDVFWRVLDFDRVTKRGANAKLKMEPRVSNTPGDLMKWNKDYPLNDLEEYVLSVKNYIPVAENRELPPNAVISVKEDTTSRLQLPEHEVELERNRVSSVKVGVSEIDFPDEKYAKLVIETELGEKSPEYPPGSVVELTVSLSKSKGRLIQGLLAGAVAIVCFGGAGTAAFKEYYVYGIMVLVLGIAAGWYSYWCLTGKFKATKPG